MSVSGPSWVMVSKQSSSKEVMELREVRGLLSADVEDLCRDT